MRINGFTLASAKQKSPHSERSEESLLDLTERGIPRFARNDSEKAVQQL
jgi:hypothetical protein